MLVLMPTMMLVLLILLRSVWWQWLLIAGCRLHRQKGLQQEGVL